MVIIQVSNVWCTISGQSQSITDLLYDKLSYELDSDKWLKLKNKKLIGIDLRKRLFQPKRGRFLKGLLQRVEEILNSEGVNYTLQDNRSFPEQYNYYMLKKVFPELRYYQKEVIELFKEKKSMAASLVTGSGKTLIIMSAIKEIGVNTLVITPNLSLKEQFLGSLELHFGKKYVGTHEVEDVEDLKPITVANIQGLQNKDQKFFDKFDMVIWDEAHHTSADTYFDLNKDYFKHISYRLTVTATPYRTDGSDMKLEAITGKIQYEYTAKQAIKDGYINPPHFLIYDYKHPQLISQGWFKDYERLIETNMHRNRILVDLANKFITKTNKNVVILTQRVEHCNILQEKIPDSIVVTGETKGKEKIFEQYRLGNIRCLIATAQTIGEGIDIPNINVLLLAGGYQSDIYVSQAIGRVVRLDAENNKRFGIVVDIRDLKHKIFQRHSESRIELYETLYGKEYVRYMENK